jgi:hypothetical protein
MNYFGATLIAGVIFFVLNLLSTLLFQVNVTTFSALLEAVVKTAIFGVIFHYTHNFVAGKLGWYDEEDDQPNGE